MNSTNLSLRKNRLELRVSTEPKEDCKKFRVSDDEVVSQKAAKSKEITQEFRSSY